MISTQDRKEAVKLIKETNAAGARLVMACKELNISVRTYQRWNQSGEVADDKRPSAIRPEPKNKLTQQERQAVIETVNQPEYTSLPPSQIVPDLADKGIYLASESTMYRILKECKMQHHRGRSKKPSTRIPESHVATSPNQVWSWDITWLPGPVKGIFYRLYLILDIFSRKAVGWEVWETEEAAYAEQLIKKAVIREGIKGSPLILHSDNGSPMKASSFLVTLEKLGVKSSFSRPRVSNDNPFSEAMFRTCKYRPEYTGKGFASLNEARKWIEKFIYWYNYEHHHSGIQFLTPNECHHGKGYDILEKRKVVYEAAKQKHPERWTRETRKWQLPEKVSLNPVKETNKNESVSS